MAEPIVMAFGMLTVVGPRNHLLDGGPDPPLQRGNFRGGRTIHCKVCGGHSVMSSALTAEPIEMPFGMWTWVGPRNRVFAISATPFSAEKKLYVCISLCV